MSSQQDVLIYNKAKAKVNHKNLFIFIIMFLYFTTLFILFQLKILNSSLTNFTSTYLGMALSQLCLYGVLFLLLSFGKRFLRFFYWIGWLYSVLMLYVPIQFMMNDLTNFISYLVLAGTMLLMIIICFFLGKSYRKNKWAKIFFNKEIEVEEDQDEEDLEVIYLHNDKMKRTLHDEIEDTPYELPQLCLRLGICIYASLMFFPILLQIGASLFQSQDLQSIFAPRDIFIFCIFTALIWTLPLFFYYYNHPLSRKVTILCIVLELVRIAIYGRIFYGYYQQDLYSLKVFIYFIIVEVVRYALLLVSIAPIWKMEMPEMANDDDEYA